jgi:glutathione S-transferase
VRGAHPEGEQNSHEPQIAVARYWISILKQEERFRDRLVARHFALTAMNGHLGRHDFFVDERFSIADIALYAYTHVADEGGLDLKRFPAVRRWLERVRGQPGHVPMLSG